MPRGGKIKVATCSVHRGTEAVTGGSLAPGPYVVVSITDEGTGIDSQTLPGGEVSPDVEGLVLPARWRVASFDEEGEQCTTREAARAHAVRIARELEAEGQFDAFAVKVTDEQGNEVAIVPIGAQWPASLVKPGFDQAASRTRNQFQRRGMFRG